LYGCEICSLVLGGKKQNRMRLLVKEVRKKVFEFQGDELAGESE
jgi:hypothetical protein